MKKIAKLGLGIILSTIIVACGDSKEETASKTEQPVAQEVIEVAQNTVTYQLGQAGVTIKITLYGEGDKIVRQQTESIIEYSAIGAENAEQAKEILADAGSYDGLKGVTYSMNFGDTAAVEKIDIDFNKADLKELAELQGSSFDENSKDNGSFKATTELLEQAGFTKAN